MNNLCTNRIIDIQKLVSKLGEVKRVTYNPGGDYENDVEHSYSLAMMAWLIGPKTVPHLDQFKLVTMAMIHDLVEVYAGDTFCFASKQQLASKKLRERIALNKLLNDYKDFPELIQQLNEYEDSASEEARFIYALDKLQGVIINYLDGGRVWREENISYEQMVDNKLRKTRVHPQVHKYMKDMAKLLAENQTLFPSLQTLSKLQQSFALV